MARATDHLRAPSPWIGRRGVPAFAVLAAIGLVSGVAWSLALQLIGGRSLTPILVTTGLGLAACSVLAFATRLRNGRTALVFFHHLALVVASGLLAARLTGDPLLATLDVVAAGMLVMLSIGRIGCHLGGCCHGRPVRHGVVYQPRDFPFGSQGFAGTPLAPVQLAESLGAAALSVPVAWFVIAGQAPGVALATTLCGYGLVRIVTEAWRGDRGRRGPAVANNATLTAIAAAIAGIVLLATAPSGGSPWPAAIAAAILSAAIGYHVATRGRRLRADDLLLPVAMARNAARDIVPDGPILARSGVAFEVARRAGRILVHARAQPPLTRRDMSRLQHTLDVAVASTVQHCPPVVLEQGATPS